MRGGREGVNNKVPEEAEVCNGCGTRYGRVPFNNGSYTMRKGTCWCCGREASVSGVDHYSNLPHLPDNIRLLKPKE